MVLKRLKEILSELFDTELDEITMQTSFIDDLYADSLDITELLMILEEEFDLEGLCDKDLSPYETVGDVVKHVEGRVGQ